jgi:hypothetical protein
MRTSIRVQDRAYNYGFVRIMEPGIYELTPRGQAALAAPRMTAAELAMLERLDAPLLSESIGGRDWKVIDGLVERGWVAGMYLTPAGLTALNNMRAAMGSAEYKETTK